MALDVRSGSAMFVSDASLRIVAWNAGAERLTGTPAAEALGKRCWEIVRAVDPAGRLLCGSRCARARMAAHAWPVDAQELDIRTAAGSTRVVVDTVTARSEDSHAVVHVLRESAAQASAPVPEGLLTPRQTEVLALLADGRSAREIAGRLSLSEPTVRNHIRAILRELDAHSQLEALSKARRLGLVA